MIHSIKLDKIPFNRDALRAGISITLFLVAWEIGARSQQLFGSNLLWTDLLPPPSGVLATWYSLVATPSYWQSCYLSTLRVMTGFVAAVLLGVPLGLLMARNRIAYGTIFPVFEVLRPIPPLAWVPASIIFWPTQELSIAFVTFLGAFTTIVINVLGGVRSIEPRYFEAARSMGASRSDIFRRIVLPATMPSIVVGMEVGIGITWAVVVAAEMISGGGKSLGGAGGGLGYFIWNSYVGGNFSEIIVGMISIGIAGFIASAVLRKVGKLATPWLHLR